jgi:hypothetical protein
MQILAGLRIAFGVLVTAAAGIWLARSTWSILTAIWNLLTATGREPFYRLDGPPPLSFFYYAGAPITALITLLAGIAILQRWWHVLALWFSWFLASAVVEWIWLAFILDWKALLAPYQLGSVLVFLAGTIVFGFAGNRASVLAYKRSASAGVLDHVSFASLLALVTAISYLVRAIVFSVGPEATWAVNILRGTEHTFGGEDDVVIRSVVGLGIAVVLFVGIPRALKGAPTIMNIALAAMASLSLTGILASLDMVVLWELFRHWPYGFQEGIAFITSVAALAIGLVPRWRLRGPSSSLGKPS